MKDYRRAFPFFSLCGLNCGLCPMHYMDHPCPGCGGGEGNQSCKIITCSLTHGSVEYCYECGEYPCAKYEGIDAYDSFITHRNQLKEFDKVREIGMAAYQSELKEKVDILQYLLEHYNDGRRKSFFCVAVNLLDLRDIKTVLKQVEAALGERDEALGETGEALSESHGPNHRTSGSHSQADEIKSRSTIVARLFQDMGDKRGIPLKLNRKSKRKEKQAERREKDHE